MDETGLEEGLIVENGDVIARERKVTLTEEERETCGGEGVMHWVVIHVRHVTSTHMVKGERNDKNRNTTSGEDTNCDGSGGGSEFDCENRLETNTDSAREEREAFHAFDETCHSANIR